MGPCSWLERASRHSRDSGGAGDSGSGGSGDCDNDDGDGRALLLAKCRMRMMYASAPISTTVVAERCMATTSVSQIDCRLFLQMGCFAKRRTGGELVG
jgi:hypothetical protein